MHPTTLKNVSISTFKNKILIVEDDLDLQAVIRRIISKIDKKIEIKLVTTSEEAKKLLQEKSKDSYNLIIADYTLSGTETGLDLWKYCSENHSSTPFMMISALEVEKFLRMIGDEDVSPAFLPKPFASGECSQVIKGLLEIA